MINIKRTLITAGAVCIFVLTAACKNPFFPETERAANSIISLTSAAMPVSDPAAGETAAGTAVTLFCPTEGAEIWYTTDENALPAKNGAASVKYDGPIIITVDTVIKAIACKDGMNDSEMLEARYTIKRLITPLNGSAAINGIHKIGEVLTVNTNAITGAKAPFVYQWHADDAAISGEVNADYTVRGADAGKRISCLITHDIIPGRITATGEVVPYTIVIDMQDNIKGDIVTAIPDTGHDGDSITLAYTVAGTEHYNQLEFQNITQPVTGVLSAESGMRTYTMNAEDAIDGVIIIKAVFLHDSLIPDHITFEDTMSHIHIIYGDNDNLFTNKIDMDAHHGTGNITYFGDNAGVAAVNMSTGDVTIHKAGSIIITAEKKADAVYSHSFHSYTLTIGRKPVTITGLDAENKTYDGTTAVAAAGTPVINGALGGDEIAVSAGTAAFMDKNVGDNKIVMFSGYSLSGPDADNYILQAQPENATAHITPLQLTIEAPSGTPSKTYDGSAVYTGTGIIIGNLANKASGDTVNVSISSAMYNSANVTDANQITIAYKIDGADAVNYLAPVNGTITAGIARAPGAAVTQPILNGSPAQTSITVNMVTLQTATGQSIEYAIGTNDNETNLTTWQSGVIFDGLTAGITYYVYARSASADNYLAGAANISTGITIYADQIIKLDIEQIVEGAPVLSDIIIYRSSGAATAELAVNNPEQYTSIEWYYNNILLGTEASIELNSGDIRYNMIGPKFLTVEVTKDNKLYNTTITFMVAE